MDTLIRKNNIKFLASIIGGGSRAAATSNMERFVIIALTITTRCPILDVAAVLDPPLIMLYTN